MAAILKASAWLTVKLNSVMQLDSHEALCMEYYVCTSILIVTNKETSHSGPGANTRLGYELASYCMFSIIFIQML